ncbi:nucleotidyltransferase domain-containing protein [Fibrella arboris]|uniref:nucleotidyltransferase domain-containing protein n=1 Tax=Fibrella arboris TaxID=3242486 RepID=UPI003522A8D9
MTTLQKIMTEFKQLMVQIYGDQLKQVLLYGSYARGENTSDSDIDLAVILKTDRLERWREVERIAPVVVDLSSKYDCPLSPIVLEEDRLNTSQNLFIRNVRQEGISL